MFHVSSKSQYRRQRMFQNLKDGTRNSPQRSCPNESSSTMRSYGTLEAVNHPRSIFAGYPNIEMSQTSQLSMDSFLRTNSQSTNFVDVPMGQPSASMSHSSTSSADEQLRRRCYQNKGNPSSDLPNTGRRADIPAYRSLRGVIRKANSALSGDPIKSSLRAKKKEKTKKTRFAGICDTRGLVGRHIMSQGSYSPPPSLSSSRSCGSQCTTQSGCLIHQVQQDPTTTISTADSHPISHLGCSSYHPKRQNRHQYIEESNSFRQSFGENLGHNYRGSEHVRVLRSSGSRSRISSKKQNRSPSIALLDPIFSKIATPRKRLDIPYPPIQFQRRPEHIQRKEQQQIYESDIDTKNAMLKPKNGTERGYCNQEQTCTLPNDETDIGSSVRTNNINDTCARSADRQESNDDEGQTFSHDSVSLSGPGVVTGPSTLCGSANDASARNISNEQTIRSRRTPSTTDNVPLNSEAKIQRERQSKVNEPENLDARKEDMEDFKTRLQKLLSDMEFEAKANFEKVAQTITCATESKLDQKAKSIQEVMKFELSEKANAIQEETQSNLDLLGQKQTDAEKATEVMLESTRSKLEEIASASVKKIEACTESGLTNLSKFTETWLVNSCKTIANRLKPYLILSSETDTTNHRNGNFVSGQVSDVRQSRKSTDNDRLKRKSSIQFDSSGKKDHIYNFSSSSKEGEISLTQDSESVSRRNIVGMELVRPLRRSKRTKQSKNPKGFIDMDKKVTLVVNVTTPRKDKEQNRKSLRISNQQKKKSLKYGNGILPFTIANNDKTLCVTPTEGNSESLKKTNDFSEKRTLSFNKESKIEPKKSKPLRSKRRKLQNIKIPLTKKRSKIQCDSSRRRGSVPSEVVVFDDFQLSPLEGPDLLVYTKIKKHQNGIVSGAPSASKPLLSYGQKRRNTTSIRRTYKRRKKIFDVTDNDIFNF